MEEYSDADVAADRRMFAERGVEWHWRPSLSRDERRLLTTTSNRKMRTEFCRLYLREYPGDVDHGCPVDRLPPATVVTADGEVR